MDFYLLLSLSAAAASLSYLFRVSAYMEHARDWWWRRAPRAEYVLRPDEKPGRLWPFPKSRAWLLVVADSPPAPNGDLFPAFHDPATRLKPILATDDGSPVPKVWYSKEGVMLGRVLYCRMCFTFWCAVIVCVPTLWPWPGEWSTRVLAARAVQVFAVWWGGVVANAVFEHPKVTNEHHPG